MIHLILNSLYLAGMVIAFDSPAASFGVFFAVLIGVGFDICPEISRAGPRAAAGDGR